VIKVPTDGGWEAGVQQEVVQPVANPLTVKLDVPETAPCLKSCKPKVFAGMVEVYIVELVESIAIYG